jgi:dephospho-CoA kinase
MTERFQDMFTVGLTGGIGCGKSTVADLFAERGARVIDTDYIAHQLTAPGGAAISTIRLAFGDLFIMPDGAMDRIRMRELIFTDSIAKKRLESILHPLIRSEAEEAAIGASGMYTVFVIPLLFETGNWKQHLLRTLVVDCDEEDQIRRVMHRSGLAATQVQAIMATQVTRQARLAAADDVIINTGGIAALVPQIELLHASYVSLSLHC